MDSGNATGNTSSSDDDMEWDEVIIPPIESVATTATELTIEEKTRPNIEITLNVPRSKAKEDVLAKKRREEALLERVVRLESHKLHTLCLLANGAIRNRWINDEILHVSNRSSCNITAETSTLV